MSPKITFIHVPERPVIWNKSKTLKDFIFLPLQIDFCFFGCPSWPYNRFHALWTIFLHACISTNHLNTWSWASLSLFCFSLNKDLVTKCAQQRLASPTLGILFKPCTYCLFKSYLLNSISYIWSFNNNEVSQHKHSCLFSAPVLRLCFSFEPCFHSRDLWISGSIQLRRLKLGYGFNVGRIRLQVAA